MPFTVVGKIAWTLRNRVLVAQVESEPIDGISNLLEIADLIPQFERTTNSKNSEHPAAR